MKRGIIGVAIALAVLGVLAGRVVVAGRALLAEGDDLLLRGRPDEAIFAYEHAARWYLPLAPHVDAAFGRLRTLANDPATALAAWRAIRSAALASRHVWSPHAADLADANAAIAKLSASDPAAGVGAGDTPAARENWYLARLSRETGPSPLPTLLAGLGIVAWLAGAIVLARRGLDDTGRLVRRPALAGSAAIILGLACWAVGLYNA